MLEAGGAVDITTSLQPEVPSDGIHEVGTALMGADPKRSVLNEYCQTHDIKNLFVTDGAAFSRLGSENPTLTMMANTVRACEFLLLAAGRRELA